MFARNAYFVFVIQLTGLFEKFVFSYFFVLFCFYEKRKCIFTQAISAHKQV